MNKFSIRLKELRNSRNISQQKLSEYIRVSKSSINMYERGEREPGLETLEAIADFFNVDLDYLIGKNDIPNRNNINYPSPQVTEDYVTFPVVGDIAAGYENIAMESWDGEVIEIPSSYLKGHVKDDFLVLRVKGDSMYPIYHEDDKVLVLRQTTLNYSGQIGAVLYNDEYATLKKIEYKDGENWIRLVPINPSHQVKLIENEELEHCRVLGIPKLLIRHISEK